MDNEITLNLFVANRLPRLLKLKTKANCQKDRYDNQFIRFFKLDGRPTEEIRKIAFFVKNQILAINECLVQFDGSDEKNSKEVASNNLANLNLFISFIEEVY